MNRKRSPRSAFAWEEGGRVWRVSWDVSEESATGEGVLRFVCPHGVFPPMVEYGSEDRGRNAGIAYKSQLFPQLVFIPACYRIVCMWNSRMYVEDG